LNAFEKMGTRIALNDTFGEKSIILKMMFDINADNGPGIAIFGGKGNLERIPPSDRIVLLHVSKREPHTRFPVPNGNLEMDAKVFFGRS
jgi:hypothetical protein